MSLGASQLVASSLSRRTACPGAAPDFAFARELAKRAQSWRRRLAVRLAVSLAVVEAFVGDKRSLQA